MKKIHSYILSGINLILLFFVWSVLADQSRMSNLDVYPPGSDAFFTYFYIFTTTSGLIVAIFHLMASYYLFRFRIKSALVFGFIEAVLIVIRFVALSLVNNSFTTLHNFVANIPSGIVIMIINFGIPIYLAYTLSQKKVEEISKKTQRERLAKVIIDKEKVSITELISLLKVRQKTFERQLIDWAVDYSLRIDGDDIIINKDTQDDFLEALDAMYIQWQESIEKDAGKKK